MPHRALKGGELREKLALVLVSACTDREFCRISTFFVRFVVAVRLRCLFSDSDRGQW